MMPCSPAMMFCSIVGHAIFQTAGPMGPSTIDRSNFLGLVPTCVTDCEVYYAPQSRFVSIAAEYLYDRGNPGTSALLLSEENMSHVRIALANIEYPADPAASVTLATAAIAEASAKGADIICFPECYVPGYRGFGHNVPPPDPVFLE